MFPHPVDAQTTLRILLPRHAGELFAAVEANRAHLREWLPWLDGTREERDSALFIDEQLRKFAKTGAFVCGIWHRRVFVGVIGYNSVDWPKRSAVIGYWLVRNAQGRGIMTACCRAFVGHAFTEYEMERVVITVATGNPRSQAIPDRLGFRREGILREAEVLYDRKVDHTLNVLWREEWRGWNW